MPTRESDPRSPYCGTSEAARLADCSVRTLWNYRTRWPEHFPPTVVGKAPGAHRLSWSKEGVVEAVAKVRGMTGEAA